MPHTARRRAAPVCSSTEPAARRRFIGRPGTARPRPEALKGLGYEPSAGRPSGRTTSRWDLRASVLAYRMFERWRQENFFKYVREEYLIDALADYEIEPDDANRSVPNPARKAIEKELRRMRAQLGKLRASYAAITLAARPRRLPRTEAKKAKEKLRTEIAQAKARLEKLQAQHHALPRRVSVTEAQKGQAVVKLSTERKHLTNVLKMVAYHMESDLLELIRPHYKRVEEEGRTFIQAALQDAADLERSNVPG